MVRRGLGLYLSSIPQQSLTQKFIHIQNFMGVQKHNNGYTMSMQLEQTVQTKSIYGGVYHMKTLVNRAGTYLVLSLFNQEAGHRGR